MCWRRALCGFLMFRIRVAKKKVHQNSPQKSTRTSSYIFKQCLTAIKFFVCGGGGRRRRRPPSMRCVKFKSLVQHKTESKKSHKSFTFSLDVPHHHRKKHRVCIYKVDSFKSSPQPSVFFAVSHCVYFVYSIYILMFACVVFHILCRILPHDSIIILILCVCRVCRRSEFLFKFIFFFFPFRIYDMVFRALCSQYIALWATTFLHTFC